MGYYQNGQWIETEGGRQEEPENPYAGPTPSANPLGATTTQQFMPAGATTPLPPPGAPAPAPVAPPSTSGPVTPQAPPFAPTTTTQAPQTFNYDWWRTQTAGKPGTVQSLLGMESQLKAMGITVLRNAAGQAGKIQLPDGRIIDVLHNAAVGGEGWRQAGAWSPTGSASGSRLGGSVSGQAAGAGTTPSVQGGSAFNDQVRQLLMQQLQGLTHPISANDPFIKGEMDAQALLAERSRQDRRAASAERAAFTGLNSGGQGSGALDADIASGFEDKGQKLAGLQAQLFGRELQARRTQMSQMLAMALQSGDNEAARALQLQIANMDAELRRMGLRENARQFDDSFGLQAGQFQYLKDRDLASYGGGI
jgi:hypothetical protein